MASKRMEWLYYDRLHLNYRECRNRNRELNEENLNLKDNCDGFNNFLGYIETEKPELFKQIIESCKEYHSKYFKYANFGGGDTDMGMCFGLTKKFETSLIRVMHEDVKKRMNL